MTATYESLRDCKPKVKQDVLYARTPNGVIFHNATAGFQITARSGYEFASKVVPHLNGRNSVGELCSVLPEAHHPMLVSLVNSLLERGFARDAEADAQLPDGLDEQVANHFAAQINYIDHYTGGAKRRFLAARQTTVAVIGSGHVARWCVLSLIRNGVAEVSVSPDLVLDGNRASSINAELANLRSAGIETSVTARAAADDAVGWPELAGYHYLLLCLPTGSQRLVRSLLEAGIPEGVSMLAMATFGRKAVVGPLMSAGRAGCWMCAALRLSANGDPAQSAELWSELAGAGSAAPAGTSQSLGAMLGNLLGYEVFRSATGAMPPETLGAVILQDQDSMDVSTEPLLPHPACQYCAAAEPNELSEVEPVTEARIAPDAVDRSDDQFETAQTRSVLLGETAGVFGSYQDAPYTQLPLKIGQVSVGVGHGRSRTVTAFDLHHTIGARLRALRTAAAVYADCNGAHRATVLAAEPDLRRIESNRIGTRAVSTTVPQDAWVRGTSLLDRQPIAVPAAAVWPSGPANSTGVFHQSGAGVGVAENLGVALANGLSSALAFDRLLAAGAGRCAVFAVGLDELAADPQLDYLVKSSRNLGANLELLQLAGDGLPVLLARAVQPGTDRPVWALAGGLDWAAAAADAIRDVLGVLQLGAQLPARATVDTGLPILDSFDPYLLSPAGPAGGDRNGVGDWQQVLAGLRAGSQDAVLLDTGSADLATGGLHVLRVLLVTSAER